MLFNYAFGFLVVAVAAVVVLFVAADVVVVVISTAVLANHVKGLLKAVVEERSSSRYCF